MVTILPVAFAVGTLKVFSVFVLLFLQMVKNNLRTILFLKKERCFPDP